MDGGEVRALWSLSLLLVERFGPVLDDEELDAPDRLPASLCLSDADLGFLARNRMVWDD